MSRSALLFLPALLFIGAADLVTAQQPALQRQATPWEPRAPQASSSETVRKLAPVPALTSTAWTLIGPSPLNSNSTFGNVSGRITGIAVDPTNPNTIYITAAGGGVWKTINGGTNWTPQTDGQMTLSMGSVAVAPSNPNVIYAGTGETNNSGDSNFGRGILVSTNGGATWTLSTGPAGIFNNNRLTIGRIAVDPTASGTAYASVASFGVNGICCVAGTTGIWKTTDTGVTWTNVTSAFGLESTRPWSDVQLDQNAPATVYAAHGDISGQAANGVYKSTNGGTTWALLAGFPSGATVGRIALAVATANTGANKTLYVTAHDPAGNGLLYVRRSDDGGATSTDLTANPGMGNYLGGQGWYDTVVTVDPANSAIVIVSGASASSAPGSILRSADSGANWANITSGVVRPHVDHHAGAFAGALYLDGDDGGIYRMDNPVGPVWSNLNGDLATIQFQGIGLHPTDPNQVLGGSQDNGTERFTGDTVWSLTDGGDGGFVKFSQTNGNIAYHQIPNASFGTNFFRFSSNGGVTWTTHTTSISADVNVQNFYAPFVVDPGNGDRVLYGTNGVWETTNQGVAWTKLAAFPISNNVSAIGLAPSTTNTIYAATGTNVFVTTNHGVSWTTINTGLPAARSVQDLQVDPATPTTAYAMLGNFTGAGNVYKTINGGTTWTNISGNLAAVTACACSLPVWSMQIDAPAGKLYIGAEDGVYVTADGGTTWSRFGTGLPNAQVLQIELNKNLNILGAATHGRSAWEISTAPVTVPDLTITKSHTGNFTQGTTGVYNIVVTNSGTGSTTGTVTVTDVLPGGMTLASFTGTNWTCTGTTTVTCTSTQVVTAGNPFPTIALTVNVPLGAPATVTNTATVAGGGETNTNNNTANDPTTINPLATPDLTITKSHTGNFTQGTTGVYNIVVTNSGSGPTTGTVTVTDVLPGGMTLASFTGTNWTCTGTTTVTCTSTQVVTAGNPFPTIALTVNVPLGAPATVTNTATVAGGGETNTTNNTANDPTTIVAANTTVDAFQVRYASNLTNGDAVINITNTGANGASLNGPGFGGAAGNICVNVYAFSPDEQLVSCCSCLITPNGLVSLSVTGDLISNTLTGVRPNSVVVKLVNTAAGAAFTGTNCTNSAALAGQAAFPLAGGMLAFGTTLHAGAAAGTFPTTETPFLKATLSPAELASITNRCTNIVGNGSTFGICRSCRVGGLDSSR